MTLKLQFDHIGIPVNVPQETEFWVPRSECWVTNPRTHPQRIEYLRFETIPDLEAGSPQWKLWNMPHVAYRVDNLEAALGGEELIYGPFEPGDFATVAFIHKQDVVIEYLEYADTEHWFDQPTPWQPA
ncbi:MAG: hypothetical protein QGH11_03610 [Pirellulaceae bacterium]|nr:hypothetical protein [Pirellulaceae bacterium]